jgi:hypothetical protein
VDSLRQPVPAEVRLGHSNQAQPWRCSGRNEHSQAVYSLVGHRREGMGGAIMAP